MQRRTFLAAMGASVLHGKDTVILAEAGTPEQDTKRYRVIDTHLHLFNAHMGGESGIPRNVSLDATIERYLEAMERGGVDKAFLITYNAEDIAEQFILNNIDPASLRLVYNTKYQKAAWRKHRDLFWWFPDHNNPLRETYLEDLQRNFEEGAAGIKLIPIFHGYFPDHPGFFPIYEMCRKYKKPIILDLSYWYVIDGMPPRREVPSRRNLVQRFSDYAKLLSPIFREFSTVPFSLAHAGTAKIMSDYDEIFTLINDHENVSCDTGAVGGFAISGKFFQFLAEGIGARKIMYGTDWPYWASGVDSYLKGSRRWTHVTEDCPKLSQEEKQWILADNAERFVKNQLPRPAARREGSKEAQKSG